MTTITVTVDGETRRFTLVHTNAPPAYDSGGAIQLAGYETEGKWDRYILIPSDQLAWQQGRNASGLHSCETDDLLIDPSEIRVRLWRKLYGDA